MRTKSKKPGKQRYYQHNTPKYEVHKLMSAHLTPELRERKGFRSLPVKVGDTVIIMRGSFKGKSGKVTRVNPTKKIVFVDKVFKRKTDNTEIPTPIHPSNLMISKYDEKDRKRLQLINRRIKDVAEKIDIEATLAEAAEDEVIEIDDADLNEEFDDKLVNDLDDDIEFTDEEAEEEQTVEDDKTAEDEVETTSEDEEDKE